VVGNIKEGRGMIDATCSRLLGLGFLGLILGACGGGGGGSSSPPPQPSATLTASVADIRIGGNITLQWSSQNATSCSASGSSDWTGNVATSGSKSVPVNQTTTFSISCSGSTASPSTSSATVTAWNAPTATLTSSDAEILSNNTVELSWSSQNAKTCKGVSGIAETISLSGKQTSATLNETTSFSIECQNPVFDPVRATTQIAVRTTFTLTITYEYERAGKTILDTTTNPATPRPDFENPTKAPIPRVFTELRVKESTSVPAQYTDMNGRATFANLSPSRNYTPTLVSKALSVDGLDIAILNNRNPINTSAQLLRERYRPYENSAAEYTPDKKKVSQTLSILVPLGYDKTTKQLVDSRRESGPYSIVDSVIRHQQFLSDARASTATGAQPPVAILWASSNKGNATGIRVRYDEGVAPFVAVFKTGHNPLDASGVEQASGTFVSDPHIFLTGAQDFGLTEQRSRTPIHEMTHFSQQYLMRKFTPGGRHSTRGEWQDFTLALHEGLATGIPLMIENSPISERVFPSGNSGFFVEQTDYRLVIEDSTQGWFQERTLTSLKWKLYDPAGPTKLTASKVLAPYFSSDWVNGPWVSNPWAYGTILKQQNPTLAGAIDLLGSELKITLAGNNVWGDQETILGNRTAAQTLPVITRVPTSGSIQVCSVGKKADYNYLSNRRYLRFEGDGVTSRRYNITGAEGTVPFVYVNSPRVAGRPTNRGNSVNTGAIVVPNGGTWGYIGECSVLWSTDSTLVDANCGSTPYTAPEQTCWTITAQ
jgi:hypothetical protein